MSFDPFNKSDLLEGDANDIIIIIVFGVMMMVSFRRSRGIDFWSPKTTQDLQNASNGVIWAHSERWQPRLSHSHLRGLFSARLESTQCLGRFRQIYQTESAESAESDPFWEFVEHRNRISRISRIVPGLSLLNLSFQRVCIRSFKNQI